VSVTCPICGEELEGPEAIAAHDHEVPVSWEDAGAGFECPSCGRSFDSEEHLVAHQATEHA
jgi:transcription initiation factor IIE alpha subunit